jgi:IMP dehydrogenase
MKVKSKMTINPITIQVTSLASEALNIMHLFHIRHLIVLNNNVPIGVLSINDFPKYIKNQLVVFDIMTHTNVVVINENEEIGTARDLLIGNKIGCLPVINNLGSLTGILTITDILS